jgi:uncharacterized protein (TIGR02246 family)
MRHLPLAVLVLALGCSKETRPSAASDEATIRGLDSAWAKAAADKNVDGAIAVYADDATIFDPGAPMASGKAAIRASWTSLLGTPGSTITWGPDKIDVSGDRATDIGTYTLTATDKAGKPQTTKARYVIVWGRHADGTWKVLVDVTTTTL